MERSILYHYTRGARPTANDWARHQLTCEYIALYRDIFTKLSSLADTSAGIPKIGCLWGHPLRGTSFSYIWTISNNLQPCLFHCKTQDLEIVAATTGWEPLGMISVHNRSDGYTSIQDPTEPSVSIDDCISPEVWVSTRLALNGPLEFRKTPRVEFVGCYIAVWADIVTFEGSRVAILCSWPPHTPNTCSIEVREPLVVEDGDEDEDGDEGVLSESVVLRLIAAQERDSYSAPVRLIHSNSQLLTHRCY